MVFPVVSVAAKTRSETSTLIPGSVSGFVPVDGSLAMLLVNSEHGVDERPYNLWYSSRASSLCHAKSSGKKLYGQGTTELHLPRTHNHLLP